MKDNNKKYELKELKLNYYDPKKSTWIRTMSTFSSEWKQLRKKVLSRDDNTCNFCGTKTLKEMIVSHYDGETTDNSLNNLVSACLFCNAVRNCGTAANMEVIALASSKLSQVEIVRRTYAFYLQHHKKPTITDIDSNAKLTEKYRPFQVVDLLKADPNNEEIKDYKVFFTNRMTFKFMDQPVAKEQFETTKLTKETKLETKLTPIKKEIKPAIPTISDEEREDLECEYHDWNDKFASFDQDENEWTYQCKPCEKEEARERREWDRRLSSYYD